MDTIEDYKKVQVEEYASAVMFGVATVVFGYWGCEGIKNDQNTFSTLLSIYLAMGCGSLVKSSFEQGRKMSREVSELEKEIRKEDEIYQ